MSRLLTTHEEFIMLQKYCAIILLLLIAQTTMAASFNCDKATKKIEIAICVNTTLDQLDTKLGVIYEKLQKASPKAETSQLRKGQIAWIKQRDEKCTATDVTCLTDYYQDRIAILTTQLSTESSKKSTASVIEVSKLDSQSKVLLRSINPINFGMSTKDAETAAGVKFSRYGVTDSCQIITPMGELKDNITFVAVNDQIVAVNIYSGKITTKSGIGIDSLESQILKKYTSNIQLLGSTTVDGDEFRMLAFVPKDDTDKDYRIIFTIFDNKVHSFSAGQLPYVQESCNDTTLSTEAKELNLLSKLQGKWQSTEDNASIVEITDNTWTDIYDNERDVGMNFDIMTACLEQDGKVDENGSYLQVGGDDGFCYNVDDINNTHLVLMYLPRGNILTYNRM